MLATMLEVQSILQYAIKQSDETKLKPSHINEQSVKWICGSLISPIFRKSFETRSAIPSLWTPWKASDNRPWSFCKRFWDWWVIQVPYKTRQRGKFTVAQNTAKIDVWSKVHQKNNLKLRVKMILFYFFRFFFKSVESHSVIFSIVWGAQWVMLIPSRNSDAPWTFFFFQKFSGILYQ